jgi:hypothetical protein
VEVCTQRTHFLIFGELLFMIIFLAEDSSEYFFHCVGIKGFRDGKFKFFNFFKDFTEIRLNWKVSQLPGPEANSFDCKVDKFAWVVFVIVWKNEGKRYLKIGLDLPKLLLWLVCFCRTSEVMAFMILEGMCSSSVFSKSSVLKFSLRSLMSWGCREGYV